MALAVAANPVFGDIGNPILDGWYADPQIRRYGDEYWVFPTFSGTYKGQPFFDVFSSPDLRHWTKHAKALKTEDIPWAHSALWAPDAQEKDGKYYIFFSANDTYPADGSRTGTVVRAFGDRKYGGIGVAVSDRPEGPYRDWIGKPLVDQFWNGAQPIDPYVFEYKDEWYMLYGGWGRCNLVKLAPDFKSLLPLEDGTMWRDMTPPDYVEGSVMFERRGKWYFMYSSGSWTKDNYRVNYCVGESPFGPFEFKGTVLSSQKPIATGAGHNSIICLPGTDEWYICYHRRPIPNRSGKHRVTCLDRMYFDDNGDIKPIVMTGATVLEGDGIRLVFDTADRGFNCIGIETRTAPSPVAFVDGDSERPGLWSLTFWKDGSPTNTVTIDNLAPCERDFVRDEKALLFGWHGLALGDEADAADVRATVSLTPDGSAAEWRIAVQNSSAHWGLAETQFPLLRNVVKPGEADVLIPKGNWAGRLVKAYKSGTGLVGGSSLRYPTSLGAQIQTCAFMVGAAGLQITALDGRGQVKYFDLPERDVDIRYPCPDQGVPGAANAPDFAVETAVFTGDWWTAAKRYRAWATRQQWASKGPLATRADFNRQLGDVGCWMKTDWKTATPQLVTNFMAQAMSALPGIPLGLHWYCWHTCPFDNNYPELLPARPGMEEAVSWLKGKGVLVMPYINGRLWDEILESHAAAVPSAVRNVDETRFIDKYGGHSFSVMCPTTKPWQQKLEALCDKMEDELGVNALYFDQVSASMPAPCFDKSHGHPLGGGSHWTEGYRELMRPIREKAVARGVALTSENAAEPYMDSFDAHLTWFGHAWDDVPMLSAVYSGYTVYFSSVSDKKDTLDSFCAQQGRDFIFGCQLGWNDPWILDDEYKGHLAFVERLCRERIAHKDFFLTGELLGEVPAPEGLPTVEVQWNRVGMYYDSTRFRMPAVLGAVWRDFEETRRYTVLVNISGEEQVFPYDDGAGRKTVTIPPRGVVSEIEPLHRAENLR